MTSESETSKRRRPPTIDLTATEVDSEKPAAAEHAADDAQAAAAESAPAGSRSSIWPIVASVAAGAIVVAAIVAAIVAALEFSGYLPGRQPAVQPAASASPTDSKAIADITAQLNKIQNALAAQQQPDPALVSRLAAIEAAAKAQHGSVAALSTRIDQVAGSAQAAQAQAKSATDAADTAKSTAQGGVTRGDIDKLTDRIAALESTVKSLSDKQQASSADDGAARQMIAAQALQAAVASGAPYQAELATVRRLGADQKAIAPLEPFAASGAPTAGALAHDLSALMPALMRAVEPAQSGGSFLDRLKFNANRLVRITPVDAPPGDDPRSVAARIDAEAARADISAALADIAKLPEAAKSIVAGWAQKAQARNGALTASRQLAANALAALGKTQ